MKVLKINETQLVSGAAISDEDYQRHHPGYYFDPTNLSALQIAGTIMIGLGVTLGPKSITMSPRARCSTAVATMTCLTAFFNWINYN